MALQVSIQVLQTLMQAIGYKAIASMVMGTVGRQVLQIGIGAYTPAITAVVGQEWTNVVTDKVLDTVAPSPIVVLTSALSGVASKMVSDYTTRGVYLIIQGTTAGAKNILIHLTKLPVVGRIAKFTQNLFSHPECSAAFLTSEENIETDKHIRVIDNYDPKQPKKIVKSEPALKKIAAPQKSRSVPPKTPTIMMQCDEQQRQAILENFEGDKFEVTSEKELKAILGDKTNTWKEVVDLLDEDVQNEELPWLSQSVVLDQPEVKEFAQSVLEGSFIQSQHNDLYSSWCQLIPSAPPLEDDF